MNAGWRKYRHYVWLLPLCAAALFYQVTYTVVGVNIVLHPWSRPAIPFLLNQDQSVTFSGQAAQKAGLQAHDKVVSIDGRPLVRGLQVYDLITAHRRGDFISVQFVPPGQTSPHSTTFPVEPASVPAPTVGDLAFAFADFALKLFCISLGIFVALRRPNDKRAWIAFGLLLSLSQVIRWVSDWYYFPRALWFFSSTWNEVCQLSSAFVIAAFGLYFPEQFAWDLRRPWFKWLYLGPLLAVELSFLVDFAVDRCRFHAFPILDTVVKRPFLNPQLLMAVSITVFFLCLGWKQAISKNRDTKRRLRLLEAGAAVGLGPVGLLVFYEAALRGSRHTGMRDGVVISVVALFAVFPITLAYVVLTERAMQLSVAIRQGFRYAIAKVGFRVFLFIVISLSFWRLSVYLSGLQFNDTARVLILGSSIALSVFLMRRIRTQALIAIDKKFFREQYQSEAVLSDLSDNVRTIVDEKQLFETVTHCVSAALHLSHSCVLLNADGFLRPVFASGLAIPESAELPERAQSVMIATESKEPPPIYFDRADNWIHATPEWEIVTLKGLGVQLLLPFRSKDKLLGLLCLGPKLSEEPFTKTDLNLLRSVAVQTGLALENSRLTATVAQEVAKRERLNREIEIAREVQERLFPQQLPVIAGIDYYGACRPALGVGGDYYDFLKLPNGDLGVAIGDVSGKGIAAALLMASLQASLRSQALTGTSDLAHLMGNVNKLVFEATPSNRYATFFYGQYEQQTRTFRYVNAGHNPPFILRRVDDGTVHVIRLETGGPVVGLFPHSPYQQGSLTLEAGDVFVGFTDGISEAMNREEEEWGEEQLIPAAAAHVDKPASEMIPRLMSDADRFVDGAPQHDDMTLVVVKMQA